MFGAKIATDKYTITYTHYPFALVFLERVKKETINLFIYRASLYSPMHTASTTNL